MDEEKHPVNNFKKKEQKLKLLFLFYFKNITFFVRKDSLLPRWKPSLMNMFGFTISLLSYIIVKLLIDCEYIKIIYVNYGQRRGYESDLLEQ